MGKQREPGLTRKDIEWFDAKIERLKEVRKQKAELSIIALPNQEQIHKIQELRTTQYILEKVIHQYAAGSAYRKAYLRSRMPEYDHVHDYLATY